MKQSLRMLAAALTLTLTLTLTLSLTLPALTAAETWVLDIPHTVSGFTVRHMMITNVTGAFEVTKGTIEYRLGDPSSIKAGITIEAKSINTRNTRRDDDLRSDNFLNAEKFPTITFKSKRVQNVRSGGIDLVGDLTIRDVTKEVVLKAGGVVVGDEMKINIEIEAVEKKG
jgi:polyisoprenoid-binding protein YceI